MCASAQARETQNLNASFKYFGRSRALLLGLGTPDLPPTSGDNQIGRTLVAGESVKHSIEQSERTVWAWARVERIHSLGSDETLRLTHANQPPLRPSTPFAIPRCRDTTTRTRRSHHQCESFECRSNKAEFPSRSFSPLLWGPVSARPAGVVNPVTGEFGSGRVVARTKVAKKTHSNRGGKLGD